jgi:hypothetical protein
MKHGRNHLYIREGGTRLLHLKSPIEKARKNFPRSGKVYDSKSSQGDGLKIVRLKKRGIFACMEEDDPFLLEKVGGGSF